MAAEPWHLDDRGDEDVWWAALMIEPPGGGPAGILEQVAAARPAWHHHAACRGRPDLDWFAAADLDATRAVCATCPAAAPCADTGRQEPYGVWGGRSGQLGRRRTGLSVTPAAPKVRPLCSRCGFDPAQALGLCSACLAYRERTGHDRPADVIVQHVERMVEREAERDGRRALRRA